MEHLGYSISNESYEALVNYSEQYYGGRGYKQAVLIDVIRFKVNPTPTQQVLQHRLTSKYVPEDRLDPHSYTRGETSEISFRCPEDLADRFRAEARRVYSQRKIGQYLSKAIYDYVMVLELQAEAYVDKSTGTQSDWVDRLHSNYNADIDAAKIPDDLTIPATDKVAVPLALILLRDQLDDVYHTGLIDAVVDNEVTKYTDVGERTLSNYADKVRERLNATVNPFTGQLRGIDIERRARGYYEPSNEEALKLIEADLEEWSQKWMDYFELKRKPDKDHTEKIRESIETVYDTYEPQGVDVSPVDELGDYLDDIEDDAV
ncbi:hypothetical protein [Halorubrum depositum]|uniref:hypothetical protein n=1 Tax=Halorubrum depositum TaxID=2583992 RepID=UPI0011AA243E|nr:hypothetical protein [Halorubrum depositum]